MPTLAEKKKFNFHPKALNSGNITTIMKQWLENEKAVDIIIKILNIKLSKSSKADRLYFLRGRTGSGKSTYMIQELYKQLIVGNNTKLFCTQPRVVLTKSNPTELIRYNQDWAFGKNIGVQNGSERIYTTTNEAIVYCTTQIMGNLLVELMAETDKSKQLKLMKALRIVVIDECHVLDSPMMALLKTVYDVVNKFGDIPECPLFIFSSATIDLEHMVEYYHNMVNVDEWLANPLMIADIQGVSNYPVEEHYLTSEELKKFNQQEIEELEGNNESKQVNGKNAAFTIFADYFVDNYLDSLFKSKSTITVKDEVIKCRDALLFVPLFNAIDYIGDYLKKIIKKYPFFKISKGCQFSEVDKWRKSNLNKQRVLYVGYGRNYAPASDYILETALERDPEARQNEIKIICSTSVIETGKTISTLYLCMNLGIETMSLYNPLTYDSKQSIQYLKQVPINKNQTIQRKGRVGRECPGVFVHFYSKAAYEKFRNNDIAETINNSYLSGLLLNDLSQFNIGTYKDVFNLNNYYYPTTTDILINSARDLVNAGYLTLFGQFVALCNSLKHRENWIIYAKFLFYCLGWSLWDALLLASINRKNLPPMMNLFDVSPQSLRLQLKDINEDTINDDIIDSILRAKNTMTSILYGNDETFKCSENRIYNPLLNSTDENINLNKQHNDDSKGKSESKIKGSNQTNMLNSWYCLNTLGRI